MNNLYFTITLFGALWTLFGGFALWTWHKFSTAKTKNENVALFQGWVKQAVAYVEHKFPTATGPDKKNEAIAIVTDALLRNKLFGHFSKEQISGAIEEAVKLLPDETGKNVGQATTTFSNGGSKVTIADQGIEMRGAAINLDGETTVTGFTPEPISSDNKSASQIPTSAPTKEY